MDEVIVLFTAAFSAFVGAFIMWAWQRRRWLALVGMASLGCAAALGESTETDGGLHGHPAASVAVWALMGCFLLFFTLDAKLRRRGGRA
ncbi:MAG TPA: hypothetical protein VEL03_15565 [Streptosporangiaceae bacterium]|nr:hypothetical protein [Streptosporangiaceae bacterium]